MSQNIRILGFDVSTTCIGYTVLEVTPEKEIKFISMDHFKPLKKDKSKLSPIAILEDTRNKIREIIKKCAPDKIAIEDFILFMPGKSNAQTITRLAIINRTVCLEALDYLKTEPYLYSVMSVRHGIKKNNTLPNKENIPDLVAEHLSIIFPWQFIEKGKHKGEPKVENFDRADSCAVALRLAFELTDRLATKKKKK